MRQEGDAPVQEPAADEDRSLLQRVFGRAEHKEHQDPEHRAETIDDAPADEVPPRPGPDEPAADEQRPAADEQRPAADEQRPALQPLDDSREQAEQRDEDNADERRDAIAADRSPDDRPREDLDDARRDDHPGVVLLAAEPTAAAEPTTAPEPTAAHERPAAPEPTAEPEPVHEPAAEPEPVHEPAAEPAADEPVFAEPVFAERAAEAPAPEEAPGAEEAPGPEEPTELKPGEVPGTLVATIWTEDSARDLRDRWRETQLRFVDDPRSVAEDARNLVNEVIDQLTATLASHREQLNSWQSNGDTEQYRMVVQRYRTFFDRLLNL